MKKTSLIILTAIFASLILSATPISAVDYPTDFSAMLGRAEAIVNYEWIPSDDIAVWNENPYNGSMYFKKGETIKGMPYTLFAYELGFDSLLSLEQYKKVAAENYSLTKYCTSVGANRTGPAYGSCCATFVSEVFGGSYMNGGNPRYDGVTGIKNAAVSNTFTGTVDKIRPGDALSKTDDWHIIWIGEVTDTSLTVYEQTPPIARKRTVSKGSADADGYLVYDGATYKTIIRSTEIDGNDSEYDGEADARFDGFLPFKCKMTGSGQVRCYYKPGTSAGGGHIDSGDDCTITKIFTDGWVEVLVPWDDGTTQKRYARADVFFDYKLAKPENMTVKSKSDTYYTADGSGNPGWVDPWDSVLRLYESGEMSLIIYPASNNLRCAWVATECLEGGETPGTLYGDANGDGVINGIDVTLIRRAIVGGYDLQGYDETAADVNHDGVVNGMDVTLIRRYLSGGYGVKLN